VPLETSYRSTEAVLSFVDEVFATPERARAWSGETGEIPHHTAARQGSPARSSCGPCSWTRPRPSATPGPIPSIRKEPPAPASAWPRPWRSRSSVRSKTGAVVFDKSGSARPCGYGDFLILVRRRDATFEEIIRALKAAGAPVAGADRLKLSQHIVFDDLKALARFALFPGDDLTLAEVLRGPFCDVDEDSLFELAGLKEREGPVARAEAPGGRAARVGSGRWTCCARRAAPATSIRSASSHAC
jgi:ATP-dependent helicase/nuclease subunit A